MLQSTRNMIARKWLIVAKSNTASSLRLEFAGFTDCWPAPNRLGWTVSTILFAYDETALQTTPQFLLSGDVRRLLDPDHDRIGGARGVDDRQSRKARSGRLDQALPPAVDLAD